MHTIARKHSRAMRLMGKVKASAAWELQATRLRILGWQAFMGCLIERRARLAAESSFKASKMKDEFIREERDAAVKEVLQQLQIDNSILVSELQAKENASQDVSQMASEAVTLAEEASRQSAEAQRERDALQDEACRLAEEVSGALQKRDALVGHCAELRAEVERMMQETQQHGVDSAGVSVPIDMVLAREDELRKVLCEADTINNGIEAMAGAADPGLWAARSLASKLTGILDDQAARLLSTPITTPDVRRGMSASLLSSTALMTPCMEPVSIGQSVEEMALSGVEDHMAASQQLGYATPRMTPTMSSALTTSGAFSRPLPTPKAAKSPEVLLFTPSAVMSPAAETMAETLLSPPPYAA